MTLFDLLAQTATAPTPAPEAGQSSSGALWRTLMPLALILLIMWAVLFRPKQKEKKQRDEMLGNLKKYDKVLTIGGIVGTVMEVREDEVILKVDDNSNTRMKFIRSAIQKILSASEEKTSSK